MMLIPVEAMPGYAVPAEMFHPGCFAVPMDRFGRFPGAMEQLPLPDVSPIGVTTTADNKRAQARGARLAMRHCPRGLATGF